MHLSYLIVGSGYRAKFYARIARTYPSLFSALFLCRSEEKAALMLRETGVPAVWSTEEAEAFRPDFVVVAVNKTSITDDSEFNAFFTELISCLNDEDKKLFIKIFWQGYSVEETANATGKSKEIIYNRISRGKKKIIKFNSGYFGKGTI